jgi:hypothetical protein
VGSILYHKVPISDVVYTTEEQVVRALGVSSNGEGKRSVEPSGRSDGLEGLDNSRASKLTPDELRARLASVVTDLERFNLTPNLAQAMEPERNEEEVLVPPAPVPSEAEPFSVEAESFQTRPRLKRSDPE